MLTAFLYSRLPIYLSMALQPFVGPWPLFTFLILYTVGRTPWTGDQTVARPLLIHRTTQTQNKRKQTSMPRVGFEPKIPLFERAKMPCDVAQNTEPRDNYAISGSIQN
jgi:hypothetical protein